MPTEPASIHQIVTDALFRSAPGADRLEIRDLADKIHRDIVEYLGDWIQVDDDKVVAIAQRVEDPELQAIRLIQVALATLDAPGAKVRVLRYLLERYAPMSELADMIHPIPQQQEK